MSGFRLTPQAERDLDDIWLQIAQDSGNIDTATRFVDSISERFPMLGRFPYLGRSRHEDLHSGVRSFAAGDYVALYRIIEDDLVLILRVVHGNRDIAAILRRDAPQ